MPADIDDPCSPLILVYRVKCEITLVATSLSEAQMLASQAIELWNDETGWQHVSGIGDPHGYVMVSEVDT